MSSLIFQFWSSYTVLLFDCVQMSVSCWDLRLQGLGIDGANHWNFKLILAFYCLRIVYILEMFLWYKSNTLCTTETTLQTDLFKILWRQVFTQESFKTGFTQDSVTTGFSHDSVETGLTLESVKTGFTQDSPIAEGGAKMFGVFRVKNHDFTPKNHIFFQF